MTATSSSASSSAPGPEVLSRVFHGMTEGVAVVRPGFGSRGWDIQHANPALLAISGYSLAELVGQPHGILHSTRKELTPMRQWNKGLPESEPFTQEGYLKQKSGKLTYVAWTLSALQSESGDVTQVMITYRDMTANRQLREALVHSQRLDAVGRLAGGVAHDFNNLISVINGYTEILHTKLINHPEVHKELHEIHQAGHRAAAQVRQLLAFGRRQSMDPRVIQPHRLVQEHIDILARLLGEHRSFEVDLAEDTGNVLVDPTQLQQVFLNLVLNARDATDEGGRISVSTRNVKVPTNRNRRTTDLNPGEYVLLAVSDDGVGMDDKTCKTLFEPFFTTKTAGKGTGLGLALVYGVVTQSGGHIRVQSEPGVGSTFEIYLPRSHESTDPVRGKLAPLPVTRGRETLLIVEPDSVIRKMLDGILSADGYDVHCCASCSSARVALPKIPGKVHLLIADPHTDDGEVAQLARGLNRAQPGVRLLQIPSVPAEPCNGIAATRQVMLPKPFALSTLLYEVRSLLDAKP